MGFPSRCQPATWMKSLPPPIRSTSHLSKIETLLPAGTWRGIILILADHCWAITANCVKKRKQEYFYNFQNEVGSFGGRLNGTHTTRGNCKKHPILFYKIYIYFHFYIFTILEPLSGEALFYLTHFTKRFMQSKRQWDLHNLLFSF